MSGSGAGSYSHDLHGSVSTAAVVTHAVLPAVIAFVVGWQESNLLNSCPPAIKPRISFSPPALMFAGYSVVCRLLLSVGVPKL